MRAILAVSLLALGMPAMAAAPSAESEAGSENVIVTAGTAVPTSALILQKHR